MPVRSGKGTAASWMKDLLRNRWLYLMFAPVLIWYALFAYWPMYGLVISFQKYNVIQGIGGSDWIGMRNFISFFNDPFFFRLLRNTLLLNAYGLLFGFPVPIVLAIAFNEVRHLLVRKVAQTVSYLPHFISTVVVAGMAVSFLSPGSGLVNEALHAFGIRSVNFLQEPGWFRTIYTALGIWQSAGFSAIIYFAALSGISPELYEAARMDGAGRFKQIRHVTLPGLVPTIVILLILNIGGMLGADFQKIILLYNPTIYETADVLNTYVYRKGLIDTNYGYATAVGLFQGLVGFILVYGTNWISRRASDTSLW